MKIVVTSIFIISLIVALSAMYMAWNHNPQCAYHCEGVIHWGSLLSVGGAWFAIVFVAMLAASLPIYRLVKGKVGSSCSEFNKRNHSDRI